jgi:hypothetical protein
MRQWLVEFDGGKEHVEEPVTFVEVLSDFIAQTEPTRRDLRSFREVRHRQGRRMERGPPLAPAASIAYRSRRKAVYGPNRADTFSS